MFAGPPLPLPPDLPLSRLAALAGSCTELGAWFRSASCRLHISLRAANRWCRILISGDLGFLLGRCRHVAIREGSRPVLIEAEALIQWRALQVVTGTPHLCRARIEEVFPGALLGRSGFRVPLCSRPPEEVLADCLVHGIPVAESRIVYFHPVDAVLPEPLR